MDTQKQQVIDRLQKANNVLVTVSKNPSVDQLAACIGLSLVLNKLGKHATAVYSGETPSTIEFLKPENTIEKNTDSLRDFIISLDKAKADKLRYKVEDEVVRIFITPYRTSITDQDLEFSQGDFNVDVVLAIGVHNPEDLDQAITAHGRILHDATTVTINTTPGSNLGTIDWLDSTASSLSELATATAIDLGKDVLDEQIATALLTGIVAETDRFSNEKTSANTMKISATLMAAGANQQLVATELEAPAPIIEAPAVDEAAPTDTDAPAPASTDGTLQIDHEFEDVEPIIVVPPTEPPVETIEAPSEPLAPAPDIEVPAPPIEYDDPNAEQPKVHGDSYQHPRQSLEGAGTPSDTAFNSVSSLNNEDDSRIAPSIDLPPVAPEEPEVAAEPEAVRETLQDIEKQVRSPHLDVLTPPEPPAPAVTSPDSNELNLADLQRPTGIDTPADNPEQNLNAARDAVAEAMAASSDAPTPIAALNAQPLGEPLRETEAPTAPPIEEVASFPNAQDTMTMPVPPTYTPPTPNSEQDDTPSNPDAAPPVPPPFMPPPFGQ